MACLEQETIDKPEYIGKTSTLHKRIWFRGSRGLLGLLVQVKGYFGTREVSEVTGSDLRAKYRAF